MQGDFIAKTDDTSSLNSQRKALEEFKSLGKDSSRKSAVDFPPENEDEVSTSNVQDSDEKAFSSNKFAFKATQIDLKSRRRAEEAEPVTYL